MTSTKDVVCPHCGKKDTWQASNKFRPFCSERCHLIDLGAWMDEQHRVPGEQNPSDNKDSQEDE